jgi:hypothetical protein
VDNVPGRTIAVENTEYQAVVLLSFKWITEPIYVFVFF